MQSQASTSSQAWQEPTEKNFQAASSWLTSTPAAASLPNDTKLEIYGIYKYLTSGQPSGSRPSIFYPTPRAKYDAHVKWHSHYSSLLPGKGEQEARGRYIQIARQVGWEGEGLEEESEEIDFDAPDESEDREEAVNAEDGSEASSGKKAGGMGPKVSIMAQDEAAIVGGSDEQGGIHDAVIDDDLKALKSHLASNPSSLDAKDENGNTPLHLAADRGHFEILRALLDAGADKSIQDEDGQTPFDIAIMLERTDMIPLLQ